MKRTRLNRRLPNQKKYNALGAVLACYHLRGRPQNMLPEVATLAALCGKTLREALAWYWEKS